MNFFGTWRQHARIVREEQVRQRVSRWLTNFWSPYFLHPGGAPKSLLYVSGMILHMQYPEGFSPSHFIAARPVTRERADGEGHEVVFAWDHMTRMHKMQVAFQDSPFLASPEDFVSCTDAEKARWLRFIRAAFVLKRAAMPPHASDEERRGVLHADLLYRTLAAWERNARHPVIHVHVVLPDGTSALGVKQTPELDLPAFLYRPAATL